jgi:hypothetical protein
VTERRRLLALLAGAGLAGAVALPAQPRTRGPVRLAIHPRVGDTLHLRYEQRMEVRGADDGPMGRSVATTMTMHAHSIVEASEPALTTVLAVTDSGWVQFRRVDPRPGAGVTGQRLPLPQVGSRVRLHVAPDGATETVDALRRDGLALESALTSTPAMLPQRPVAVGDEWMRDIPLPAGASTALRGAGDVAGTVRATFRLDSLGRGGRFAHVSVRAALRREARPGDAAPGTRVVSSGTLRGQLVLDRQRAWMIEMHTAVSLVSELVGGVEAAPPLLLAPLGSAPRRALVSIDQHVRTH